MKYANLSTIAIAKNKRNDIKYKDKSGFSHLQGKIPIIIDSNKVSQIKAKCCRFRNLKVNPTKILIVPIYSI